MKLATPAGHPRPRDHLPASTTLPDDRASLSFEELARLTGQLDGLAPRTRALRQRATTDDPTLRGRLDALAAACEAHVAAGRARRGAAAKDRLAANVRLLALNLYATHRQDMTLAVAIPRGKPWFERRGVPRNPILSHAYTIEQALGALSPPASPTNTAPEPLGAGPSRRSPPRPRWSPSSNTDAMGLPRRTRCSSPATPTRSC